jgi:outer membrane protein TolC
MLLPKVIKTPIIAGLAALAALPGTARAVALEDALKQARSTAPDLIESDLDAEKAEADVAAIDAAFDPMLFGSTQIARDTTEAQNSFSGDERKNTAAQVGVRKLYGSGTWTQLSYGYDRTQIEYPAAAPAAPGVPVIATGQKYNPGITNKLELQVNQPLLRNLGGREIELQKEAAGVGARAARNVRKIKEQAVQMETEQLWLATVRLKQQITLSNELITKSRKFRKLMDQRMAIGRADQVDVATAEANLVSQEGRQLALEIALEETRTRLAEKIGMNEKDLKINQGTLSRTLINLPVPNQEAAVQFAKKNRYDLKNLTDMRTSLTSQNALIHEKSRPKLDAFVSASRAGLDEKMSDSTAKLYEKNNSQMALGLKFEMSLGGTDTRYNLASNTAQLKKLDAQERTIMSEVEKSIKLAWLTMRSARRQTEQAERQVSSLKKQEAAERRKFLQARTDEIGALRFEIEALSAQAALIDADYNARSAEASVRFAIHAYPSEN